MKQIACLLLGAALAGTGCLGTHNLDAPANLPPPPPAAPPPPPVLPGQVTESNAPQVYQALSDELDRASTEVQTVPPAPPGPAPVPRR